MWVVGAVLSVSGLGIVLHLGFRGMKGLSSRRIRAQYYLAALLCAIGVVIMYFSVY